MKLAPGCVNCDRYDRSNECLARLPTHNGRSKSRYTRGDAPASNPIEVVEGIYEALRYGDERDHFTFQVRAIFGSQSQHKLAWASLTCLFLTVGNTLMARESV